MDVQMEQELLVPVCVALLSPERSCRLNPSPPFSDQRSSKCP